MKLTLKKGNTLVAVVMLVVMLFGFFPAPQPVSALSTCDWAQFVADVTVPDGTNFAAGATFNKTWRLKNIGSCTWTTGYSLVFVDGTQMNAPAAVSLPYNVAPGATIDLTVGLTAPSSAGTYRGNFQLKNASGTMFGIGAYANKSFWVEIRVAGGDTGGTGYDFVANAPSAVWTSSAATLTFPGIDGDLAGFAYTVAAPKLENGTTDTAPGLLTAPHNTYNGWIQGQYPAFRVQSGDRFQSIINCEYGATSCYVNFRLNYQIGSGPVQTFWSFNERYEGLFYRANFDLSSLAGQDVKFILFVGAAGYPTGDRALWGAPRISRGGSNPPTPTPGPGPTVTPPSSSCDRATFVADVNVPDGTVFAPNTNFTKTWRIKNTGSCTWTTNYSLVFVSGNKLGGPDSLKLTSTIGPNTSYDFSVNLTSPSAAGSYRGYWQLKNDKGQIFGIGYLGNKPWWVDIVVNSTAPTATPGSGVATVTPGPSATPNTPVPGGMVFDFTNDPGSAVWTSGAGSLPFPGTDGDVKGFVLKLASVKLEDGSTDSRPSLLTFPQNVTDGTIKGVFPAFAIQNGDHFQATIGCQFGANDCFVKYWLDYQIDANPVVNLFNYTERYEGLTRNVDIDLSSLAGKNVKFILTIGADGPATGDRALWVAPRIMRGTTTGMTPLPPTSSTGSDLNKNGLAYANPFFGYQFKSPKTVQITDQQQNSIHFVFPVASGTNLGQKWMDVTGSQVDDTASCKSSDPIQSSSENVTINGLTFLKQIGMDAGAGQRYNWTAYSTTLEKTCVTFSLVLKSSNPDNFPTPPPLFDLAKESAIITEMVSTFGWLQQYAVYNIKSSDSLNVRTGAGIGYPVATTLPFDKKNVFRSGPSTRVGSSDWWQIYKPDGSKGWVNASYLTEYRTPANACTDARIGTLIKNFETAVKAANGSSLSNLVSPRHGLDLRYSPHTAAPVNLSKSALTGIFTSGTSYNWGADFGSGLNVVGTFKDKIKPKLLDVLNASYQVNCNDTSHTGAITQPWPSEYNALNFYALYKPGTPGTELDWRTWIAGIEYVNGLPTIAVLVQYQWEP